MGDFEVSLLIREQIKKRRKQLAFTLKDISKRMNLGISTVRSFESGASNISAVRLYALSKVLNVRIEYFFNKQDEMSPEEMEKSIQFHLSRFPCFLDNRKRFRNMIEDEELK